MTDAVAGRTPSWPKYALPHGTAVNGYVIDRVLGSGGFGITYLAKDDLGQLFAIKEYFPREFSVRQDMVVSASSDEELDLFDECLARFRREAQTLVHLSRTSNEDLGFVRVITYFTAHGTGFLVMEYVEGITLAEALRNSPTGLSSERVRSLMAKLASAVRSVHRAGLLHRDIKPANIIVRTDGTLVLIDFGSSRDAAADRTRTYTQIYSTGYAPIEQMLGLRQRPFSDIYAIGAVCYHAIGGQMIDAMTRHRAISTGQADPQPTASQIGAGRYPASLLIAIDMALRVDPETRPRDADMLIALLGPDTPADNDATVLSPRPKPVVSATPTSPTAPPRPAKWKIAVLLVIPAAALAVYLAVIRGTAEHPLDPGHRVPPRQMPEEQVAGTTGELRRDLAGEEAAKQEAARQEAAQQEAIRQEAARSEVARQEAIRQEAARHEAARQEATRQEAAREEAARQEAVRQEAARKEAAQQEAIRQEVARKEAAKQEAIRQEAAQRVRNGPSSGQGETELRDDDTAWRADERRAVQMAMTSLRLYRGPFDGVFSAATRASISRWQTDAGTEVSGRLTVALREQLLAESRQVKQLLAIQPTSPLGTNPSSVKGAEARFNLATDFETGRNGQTKYYLEAAYWYAGAAADNWPAAYTNLGTMFARGQASNTAADYASARLLWRVAATLGDPTAMYDLGVLAEKGIGEARNLTRARQWYARGAGKQHSGSIEALRRLDRS